MNISQNICFHENILHICSRPNIFEIEKDHARTITPCSTQSSVLPAAMHIVQAHTTQAPEKTTFPNEKCQNSSSFCTKNHAAADEHSNPIYIMIRERQRNNTTVSVIVSLPSIRKKSLLILYQTAF